MKMGLDMLDDISAARSEAAASLAGPARTEAVDLLGLAFKQQATAALPRTDRPEGA